MLVMPLIQVIICVKRMNPNIALGAANWDGATSSQNYYLFRYAEVLLNYAEARNESVGQMFLFMMQ